MGREREERKEKKRIILELGLSPQKQLNNVFKSDDLSCAQTRLSEEGYVVGGTRCPWFYRRLSKLFTVRQERFESCVRENFLISTLKEHRGSPSQRGQLPTAGMA